MQTRTKRATCAWPLPLPGISGGHPALLCVHPCALTRACRPPRSPLVQVGYTPLICAAVKGQTNVLKDLLKLGCDPNVVDNVRLTTPALLLVLDWRTFNGAGTRSGRLDSAAPRGIRGRCHWGAGAAGGRGIARFQERGWQIRAAGTVSLPRAYRWGHHPYCRRLYVTYAVALLPSLH